MKSPTPKVEISDEEGDYGGDDEDFVPLERDYHMETTLKERNTLMQKITEIMVPIEAGSFFMPRKVGLIWEIVVSMNKDKKLVQKLTQVADKMHLECLRHQSNQDEQDKKDAK